MENGIQDTPGALCYAVFQALVNYVFRNLLNNCLFIYLDDILIFLETEEEHVQQVPRVLRQLMENGSTRARQGGLASPMPCHVSEREVRESEPILAPGCVTGQVAWAVERRVHEMSQDTLIPAGGPPGHLYKAEIVRAEVLDWGPQGWPSTPD